MKSQSNNLILFLLLICAFSCKKEEPTCLFTPTCDTSQVLRGEFQGKLNGEDWVSQCTVRYGDCLGISILDVDLKQSGIGTSIILESFEVEKHQLIEFGANPPCRNTDIEFFPSLIIYRYDAIESLGFPYYLDTLSNPDDWGNVEILKLKDKKVEGRLNLSFLNYTPGSFNATHPFGDRIVLEGEFSAKLLK